MRTSQGEESVAWPQASVAVLRSLVGVDVLTCKQTSHVPVQPGNFYCSWGVEWKSLRRLTFRWMRNALPLVKAVLLSVCLSVTLFASLSHDRCATGVGKRGAVLARENTAGWVPDSS